MLAPQRILVVYSNPDPPDQTRLTMLQHIHTMDHSDVSHEITYFNTFDLIPKWWDATLQPPAAPPKALVASDFDVIIFHYSFLSFRILGWHDFPLWRKHFEWLKSLPGLKIAIPQDEGDFAAILDEWLYEWGVDAVFSVHYREDGPLYPHTRRTARIYPCLPGYIHEATAQTYIANQKPLSTRPLDIAYRARRLPLRYGKAGQMKARIADVVKPHAQALGLRCDISASVEDAIPGSQWLDFITSSKAVLGTEGGWSMIDWRGEIRVQTGVFIASDPNLSMEDLNARLPPGWDDYHLLTITPRHFEAILTQTAQILIHGEYKHILQPDVHYISLDPDFTNLDDVLGRLHDLPYLEAMVERAYEDVYVHGAYTYRDFAGKIEQAILDLKQAQPQENMPMNPNDETKQTLLERQLLSERHKSQLWQAEAEKAKLELEKFKRNNLHICTSRLAKIVLLFVLINLIANVFLLLLFLLAS